MFKPSIITNTKIDEALWEQTEATPAGYVSWTLTQEQHKPTMAKDSKMPAVPTIQVSRRNRMTPRMFWRQGR